MARLNLHLKCFENNSKSYRKCIVHSHVKFLSHLEIVSAKRFDG